MNNAQQALSNDDPEVIRRLQREWRIAKRKELEEKKRKKKYRTLETTVIQDVARGTPHYITVQSNNVALPQSSAPNVHFQFQPHVVQAQTTVSGPLFVSATQVGSAPSHSQLHPQVEHVDGKHHQSANLHSASNIPDEVPPRSQDNAQYSSHHGVLSNRDGAQCSPSSLPHGMVQEIPGSMNMSAVASQPLGTHYLSPAREGSSFTALGEHKASHVQGAIGAQRSIADVHHTENAIAVGHGMTEEARKKMEIEQAQRLWRKNKRKELAMKQARAASSKRGRKRTKFVHHHQVMSHPVQVVSTNPPLHSTVSFSPASGVTSALPVSSSSLHVPSTTDQLHVSSGEIPSAVVRSMGASVSEPISTSIAMPNTGQVSVSFPLSSVPIPSSVAVPVVPALTIQHVQSSNFGGGTGHDPDAGFNSLPLNTPHQFSNIVTTERDPQNGMNGTTVSNMPGEESGIAVYEAPPQNARDQPPGATTSMPLATGVCATDLMESRVQQQEASNHIIRRGDTKIHSTAPVIGTTSHGKVDNESGIDQALGDERQCPRGEKDEAVYAVQTPTREQAKDIRTDEPSTEQEVREAIPTMENEAQNRKSSPGSERTPRQFDEHGKRSQENATGKEFDDPQESFQEDGGDDLMNSVTWQGLGSIENP